MGYFLNSFSATGIVVSSRVLAERIVAIRILNDEFQDSAANRKSFGFLPRHLSWFSCVICFLEFIKKKGEDELKGFCLTSDLRQVLKVFIFGLI